MTDRCFAIISSLSASVNFNEKAKSSSAFTDSGWEMRWLLTDWNDCHQEVSSVLFSRGAWHAISIRDSFSPPKGRSPLPLISSPSTERREEKKDDHFLDSRFSAVYCSFIIPAPHSILRFQLSRYERLERFSKNNLGVSRDVTKGNLRSFWGTPIWTICTIWGDTNERNFSVKIMFFCNILAFLELEMAFNDVGSSNVQFSSNFCPFVAFLEKYGKFVSITHEIFGGTFLLNFLISIFSAQKVLENRI